MCRGLYRAHDCSIFFCHQPYSPPHRLLTHITHVSTRLCLRLSSLNLLSTAYIYNARAHMTPQNLGPQRYRPGQYKHHLAQRLSRRIVRVRAIINVGISPHVSADIGRACTCRYTYFDTSRGAHIQRSTHGHRHSILGHAVLTSSHPLFSLFLFLFHNLLRSGSRLSNICGRANLAVNLRSRTSRD